RLAHRDVLERSADVFAFRHGDRRAEQDRRQHARLDRLAVDLFADQTSQDERSLRVGDEDEAAAAVVVLQIVVPRILHVVVLRTLFEHPAAAAAGEQPAQTGERDLTVHRRVWLALRRKARELLPAYVQLPRIRGNVAVPRLIGRYRRVDVETIDRRVRIRLPRLARQLAVGRDDRRRL